MKEKDHWRIIIAGGGTGGHLFPGLAIAEEIKKRHPDADIIFVTGQRPIESKILERYGFQQTAMGIEGLKGQGWVKGMMVMGKLPYAVYQSCRMIRSRSPHLVLGVGGYSSGPMCLAGRVMGKPTAIHEQNTFPGFTNRFLCRVVHRVFISFEESRNHFPGGTLYLTGNPVRQELLKKRDGNQNPDKTFTIFVTGGSQGAMAVNDGFLKAAVIMKTKGRLFRIIHHTGEADFDRIQAEYTHMGIEADVYPFVQNMTLAYGDADMVVGRAGAATISELAALGKPSVLIPFPHAANQHQEINAHVLADTGGAELLLQKDLNGETLATILMKYMDDKSALKKMGEQAREKGRPDAARVIVDHLEAMIKK